MRKSKKSLLLGTDHSALQPNHAEGNRLVGLSPTFWMLLVLTGIMTGIAAGLLMKLLSGMQHLCYSYHGGTFLAAVQAEPLQRRIVVVCCAGVVGVDGPTASNVPI